MYDGGNFDVLEDGEVGVPPVFRPEGVELAGSHQHDLDVLKLLGDLEVRAVPVGLEGLALGAMSRGSANDLVVGKQVPETLDDLPVQLRREVEDVAGVCVEDEDDFDIEALGAGYHPSYAAFETGPVGLPVLKWKQGCDAEASASPVVSQRFLADPSPRGFLPSGFRREFHEDELTVW